MVWPAASASPEPAATTESAVFLIAYGVSNFTVGLALVSVLTVTASMPVAAPAGTAITAMPVSATETTRRRAAARVRTQDCFRRPTGVVHATGHPGPTARGDSAATQVNDGGRSAREA